MVGEGHAIRNRFDGIKHRRINRTNDDGLQLCAQFIRQTTACARYALPRAIKGRDVSRPAVLLAHQPAAIVEAAQHGIDLQLSGHTHAGQLWPWGYFVRLQQPYVFGLHRHGQSQIYVSAGTGYWGPPMRLASEAEITEVILTRAG